MNGMSIAFLIIEMKFIKSISLIFTILIVISYSSSAATVSGVGCNLGNRIYTVKIGTTIFWGDTYDVYSSNGTAYNINWNNTSQCDQINSNQVSNKNTKCWVNSYVNPPNNNTGVSTGNLANYTLQTCQVNLPLDDYIWVVLIMIGTMGTYYISKRGILG